VRRRETHFSLAAASALCALLTIVPARIGYPDDLATVRTRLERLTRPESADRGRYPTGLVDELDWHAGRILRIGVAPNPARPWVPITASLDLLTLAYACPASRFHKSTRLLRFATGLLDTFGGTKPFEPQVLSGEEAAYLGLRLWVWRARCGDDLAPDVAARTDRLMNRLVEHAASAPPPDVIAAPLLRFLIAAWRQEPKAAREAADSVRRAAADSLERDGLYLIPSAPANLHNAMHTVAALALYGYLTERTSLGLDHDVVASLASTVTDWQRWVLDGRGCLDPLLGLWPGAGDDAAGAAILAGAGLLLASDTERSGEQATDKAALRQTWRQLLPSPTAGSPRAEDATTRLQAALALCHVVPEVRSATTHQRLECGVRHYARLGYLVAKFASGGRAAVRLPTHRTTSSTSTDLTPPIGFHFAASSRFATEAFRAALTGGNWPGVAAFMSAGPSDPRPTLNFTESRTCGAAALEPAYGAAGLELRARSDQRALGAFVSWFCLGRYGLMMATDVQSPPEMVLDYWRPEHGAERESWWMVQFDRRRTFNRVVIRFYDDGERLRHLPAGILFQRSDDGVQWQGFSAVGTVPAEMVVREGGVVREFTFPSQTAACLRLFFPACLGRDFVALPEVMVFEAGEGGKLRNIAAASAGARAWASSAAPGHPPDRANDGITEPHPAPWSIPATPIAFVQRDRPLLWCKADGAEASVDVGVSDRPLTLGPVAWFHDGESAYRLLTPGVIKVVPLSNDHALVWFVHENATPLLLEFEAADSPAEARTRAQKSTLTILQRDGEAHLVRDATENITAGVVFRSLRREDLIAEGPSAFVYRLQGNELEIATAPDPPLRRLLIKAPGVTQVRLNGRPVALREDEGYTALIPPARLTGEETNVKNPP